MKTLIAAAVAASLFAAFPAAAQGPAYSTPDNNMTRTDDVDPADAENMNLEYGRSTDDDAILVPDEPNVVIEPGPPPADLPPE
jgi:hypothetical protein